MVREFIEMNVIWSWLGQLSDPDGSDASEYASLRARFDRVAATVPESEHTRFVPTLTVYASGRVMRYAKRQSKPTVYSGPTRGAHGRRARRAA